MRLREAGFPRDGVAADCAGGVSNGSVDERRTKVVFSDVTYISGLQPSVLLFEANLGLLAPASKLAGDPDSA
jgi:hypothetical protein